MFPVPSMRAARAVSRLPTPVSVCHDARHMVMNTGTCAIRLYEMALARESSRLRAMPMPTTSTINVIGIARQGPFGGRHSVGLTPAKTHFASEAVF
eukprot:4682997-Prymnesium_polylepis.1